MYYNVYTLFIYLTELHIIEAFFFMRVFLTVFIFNDIDIFKVFILHFFLKIF